MPQPVIAFSGRRIDAEDASTPAFALADVPVVTARLRAILQELNPSAIVASAACGADLLALQIAGEMGIERRIVLPFDAASFRESSVVDRPGNWGTLFDRVVREVDARNVIVLRIDGNRDAAYERTAESILDEATSIGRSHHPLIALLAWEGPRQDGGDVTREFARLAKNRGFRLRSVQTRPRGFADTPAVQRAQRVLNGEHVEEEDRLLLCKRLREELAYWHAREVARRFRTAPGVSQSDRFQFLRVEVTCTYKDLALRTETRLASALELLKTAGYDPDQVNDPATAPEVCGLTGAIYKRWWEHDGQRVRLERALHYYARGYGGVVTTDYGYQAVNAAYCLDQLARLDVRAAREAARAANQAPVSPTLPAGAEAMVSNAAAIRKALVDALPALSETETFLKNRWWFYATVGEAHLGLGNLDEAREWLTRGATLTNVQDWEYEATTMQLASLVRARHELQSEDDFDEESAEWRVVRGGLGNRAIAGAHTAFAGKFGLALSGGGFRASLYHVGVLARLAELDLLRGVEVLSCVSGGSIVGALYYLEVRHLIETTPDDEISKEDYIEIVNRVCDAFTKGVRTDVRSRLFGSIPGAARNVWQSSYSQTARLGEIFEETFYAGVADGEGTQPRLMGDLYVEPARSPDERYSRDRPFNPRLENWRRRSKVPILILNATTLNTGHAWQFTASWMGEPPLGEELASGRVAPLPRIRYVNARRPHNGLRLGHAVAASAAVPGVFDPLVLTGLYDKLVIRLVDGGVHDNQGTASLLDQDCSLLVISDGSGQLSQVEDPAPGRVAVPLRANDALMSRVRELELQLITALHRGLVLRNTVFVHLTQGLDAAAARATGSRLPEASAISPRKPNPDELLTPYGMRRDVQECLASLRTDLDAFSTLEAYGLMQSAYMAMRHTWHERVPHLPKDQSVSVGWPFVVAEPYVASIDQSDESYIATLSHLARGRQTIGRTMTLVPVWSSFTKKVGGIFSPAPGNKRLSERMVALVFGTATIPSLLHRRYGTPKWLQEGEIPRR